MRLGTHTYARAATLLSLVFVATLGCMTIGLAASDPLRFVDVTESAGLDFVETIGDDELSNLVEAAGVGCALVDYDGDGWLDIYLVSGHWRSDLSDEDLEAEVRERSASATDRLYRNRGDGTFEDVTEAAGVARAGFGMGVVAADYDADGDVDLYVTNYGPNFLYRNEGNGTFSEVAAQCGVTEPQFGIGAAFFDYDNDGILDLYVGGYVAYDPDYEYFYAPDGFPGPLAYTGEPDRLYRGNSDGTFTDVTAAAGLALLPEGRAMGLAALDYDGDGHQDLFVSNDAMANFLFRNLGDGTFQNVAVEAGVAFGEMGEATAAMAAEVGDVDNDGDFDILVPDMRFSCLYVNAGDGSFLDRSADSGIAAVSGQYISWAGVLADLDLDGDLDLYLSNGDAHHLEPQEDLLFAGDGDGGFTDVSAASGDWAKEKRVGRGAAGGDFDNDGDIDILVMNLNDRPLLLRNETNRSDRHWLAVSLVNTGGNREGIGTVVEVTVGEHTLVRQRAAGNSYLSQHDPRLHFGLGPYDEVDQLAVTWPDGERQVVRGVPADQLVVITREPGREPVTLGRTGD